MEFQGTLGDILDVEGDLDAIVEDRFAETPAFRPEPDVESIKEACAELAAAQRPVIVAGGGVIRSGAQAALVTLAERLSIPVATSLNAKATIRDDHPLAVGVVGAYARRCANEVVTAADLVFYVGSHTGSMVTNIWRTPAIGAATVLHLDIDPMELGRVYPKTVGMMGDAKAGLERLLAESTARKNSEWTQQAQAKVKAWRQKVQPDVNSDAIPIRQERTMGELSRALPDDAVVVVDTLQASEWTGAYLALHSSQQQYIRCAGSLGSGLPGAIGAKCAAGDRPVVCVTGDGGLYYHVAELETAARHDIPLVVLVNNNGAYAGERPYWRTAYGYEETGNEAPRMWTFGSRNFAQIATEMGCVGIRLENPDEIGDILKESFKSGRPTLVDVVSDPNLIADKGS